MSNILALHHVSVLVSDTQRALLFYRDLLGLSTDDSRPAMDYPAAAINRINVNSVVR